MIEDDPENQVFYGMLEALYEHNPVRVSIAGTGGNPSRRSPPRPSMPAMPPFITPAT